MPVAATSQLPTSVAEALQKCLAPTDIRLLLCLLRCLSTNGVGIMSDELQPLLDRAAAGQDRSSWFSHTPVQVLKIEREKQRAAQQAWLAEFHPTEGAKYPNRSAGLHSSMCSMVDSFAGCVGEVASCGGKVQAGRCCSSMDNEGCRQREGVCNASTCVLYPDHDDDDTVYGIENAAAGACSSTQGVGQQEDAAHHHHHHHHHHHQQQQQQQQEDEDAWEQQQGPSVTEAVAAECAAARAAAAAAAAARNAPTAPWWEADELLAQRVKQLLQPSQRQASYCCSNTLSMYDALLAANAVTAAQLEAAGQLQGEVLLQQLQTPEQLHAAWVADLRGRSAAQRLQQVLAEAAAAH
jgi:hypothetical protein